MSRKWKKKSRHTNILVQYNDRSRNSVPNACKFIGNATYDTYLSIQILQPTFLFELHFKMVNYYVK